MEFVGAGIAFPMRTDAIGGVALVAREREIQEAIRLILGTAPGERPMRPEFGCRISEHVFAPANATTAGQLSYDVRAALDRWEPRIDVDDVEVTLRRRRLRRALHRHHLPHPRHERPAQPGLPLLRDSAARPDSYAARTGADVVLPAPHLDDRDFQSLVDDAKRLVQQRSPDWTDHNVSDPGVTLIEAFAQMVDQLIYRLNRVPDRHYVKFLELIGLQLYPATAARGTATFWLAAAQPATVLVRAETEVATPRTEVDEPVVFSTVADLPIVPCEFSNFAAVTADGAITDHTRLLAEEGPTRRRSRPSRWRGRRC